MTEYTDAVIDHYSFGGLRDRIEAGLGKLDGPVTTETLGPVDEFHVGGRPATLRLIGQMNLDSDDHVLDVGSGLGGMARSIATVSGARVTGVDLTEEYVDVATWLTGLVGMADRVSFVHGSAAEIGVAGRFTAATMVHVGMNIADKVSLFGQLADALAPGSTFAIYDIMAAQPGAANALSYPVPWAASTATSHLATPDDYRDALVAGGFTVEAINDRSEAALAAFATLAQVASDGPPPLGLHLVMGPETPTKVANMAAAVRAGLIAPTEIIARR